MGADEGGTGVTDEQVAKVLIEQGNQLPFNRHLGVEVVDVAPGWCRARLRADDRLDNHLGGVHAIAELAPVELAGAIAATTRLRALLERGYVPVVGSLSATYLAPARGELMATGTVGPEAIDPALAAADEDRKPKAVATVEVTDVDGTVVATAELTFLYLDVAAIGAAKTG